MALIRRVQLEGRETIRVAAEKPKNGSSAVFVELSSAMRRDDITLALQVDGRTTAPDLFMDVGRRVYGVWYSVEGRSGKLIDGSRTVMLREATVQLRPGKVTTIRGELVPKPALSVSVNLRRGDPVAMVSGAFDALATTAPEPLPSPWIVRAIE